MLRISRSPLRVSFFGGGTDYPDYFKHYPGAVLGTAIDKYIYIGMLPMVGFAQKKYRVTYRVVEEVDHISEIKHNVVRATLQDAGYDDPLNIAILSDIPGGTGLGSSSSFTVGFVRLIRELQGKRITKLDLMREAVRIEHDILQENVGIQDQTHAAFGGLNLYKFQDSNFSIQPARMTGEFRELLDSSMMLVYTGVQRSASATVDEQVSRTREKKIHKELQHLLDLCQEGLSLLESGKLETGMKEFGKLLSDGWETKRKLSSAVTNARIDEIYEAGMRAGAYGGKLCGAGGGGFMLFLAPEHAQEALRQTFGAENCVKIATEDEGAKIISR